VRLSKLLVAFRTKLAVQELHLSVKPLLISRKNKKPQKNERVKLFGVLLRRIAWEDFSRRVATLACYSIVKIILANINLSRNLQFCKK